MGTKEPTKIDYYLHAQPSTVGQTVNPEPGYYYVSVRNDSQLALALGPFEWHQQALDYFDAVKALVEEHEAYRSPWFKFDTYRITDLRYGNQAHTIPGRISVGTLNRHFPDAPVLTVAVAEPNTVPPAAAVEG